MLGALDLARMSGEPFTEDEVDLLVQVARQIAIATENALAYRELSQIKDKLATENCTWKTRSASIRTWEA